MLTISGLRQFLKEYPGMSVRPSRENSTILEGVFSFSAQLKNRTEITDSYKLRIVFPASFPHAVPNVVETGGKIPRDGNYHVNWSDNTLCMGSPLRLLWEISKNPDVVGFAENCLVPYLYNISYKLKYGGNFILGELEHGADGIIQDYKALFRLESKDQVIKTLKLLGMKPRIANKHLCPCNCGRRLGKCNFHLRINIFRNVLPMPWFRAHVKEFSSGQK